MANSSFPLIIRTSSKSTHLVIPTHYSHFIIPNSSFTLATCHSRLSQFCRSPPVIPTHHSQFVIANSSFALAICHYDLSFDNSSFTTCHSTRTRCHSQFVVTIHHSPLTAIISTPFVF